MVPTLFERLFVKPNELEWERPYIQQNITFTRQAYNLDQMTVRAFQVEQSLTSASLQQPVNLSLRQGEALGFQWTDVDCPDQMTIRRSRTRPATNTGASPRAVTSTQATARSSDFAP